MGARERSSNNFRLRWLATLLVAFSIALAPARARADEDTCALEFAGLAGLFVAGAAGIGFVAYKIQQAQIPAWVPPTITPTPTPTPIPTRFNPYRDEANVASVQWCPYEGEDQFKNSAQWMTVVHRYAFAAPENHVVCVPTTARILSPKAGAASLRSSVEKALGEIETVAEPRLYVTLDSHGLEGALCQRSDSDGKEASLAYADILKAIADPMREFHQRTGKKPQLTLINNSCFSGSSLQAVEKEFQSGLVKEFPVTVVTATDDRHFGYGNLLFSDIYESSRKHRDEKGRDGPPALPELMHPKDKRDDVFNLPIVWSNHDLSAVNAAREELEKGDPKADLSDEIRTLTFAPQRSYIDYSTILQLVGKSQNEATLAAGFRFLRENSGLYGAVKDAKKAEEAARTQAGAGRKIAAAEAYGWAVAIESDNELRYGYFRELLWLADSKDAVQRAEVANVLGAVTNRIRRDRWERKVPSYYDVHESLRRLYEKYPKQTKGTQKEQDASQLFVYGIIRAMNSLPQYYD